MKVLVTGGAGFLGSHLCEALLKDDNEVTCIDNLSSGRLENVNHLKRNDGFRLYSKDVCADPDFSPAGIRPDAIYHLAGHASPLDYQTRQIETVLSATEGLKHALDMATKWQTPLVFSSTSEIYGEPETVPTPETYWGRVNTLGPRSCYDESKRLGETLCYTYWKAHGTDARIARIFNTFGPRMSRADGRVVPTLITQALTGQPLTVKGTGKQTRSYCYVSDTIAGLLALMDRGKPCRPVNLGNTEEMSVNQLAALVKGLTESNSEILTLPAEQDDPSRRCPDLTRAKEELGWVPDVSLKDGLRMTIDWWRSRL